MPPKRGGRAEDGGRERKKYYRGGGVERDVCAPRHLALTPEHTRAADNGPRARVPAVLCTCDTAREKSASAEAVDLITEARTRSWSLSVLSPKRGLPVSQYSDRLFPVVEDAVARDGGSASMQDLIRCAARRGISGIAR